MASITRTLGGTGISVQICNSVPDAAQSFLNLNPTLMKLEGYFISDVPVWLQLWDLNVDPAGGTSTAYSTAAGKCRRVLFLGSTQPNGFLWQYMEDPLIFLNLTNGLRACLSTTPLTYTAPNGTTEKLDELYAELEDWELEQVGMSVAGDTTSSVATLQAWASASGPQRLMRLDVYNNGNAAAMFVQLFAKDTPSVNDVPIVQIPGSIPNNTWKTFWFGRDGVPVASQGSNGILNAGVPIIGDNGVQYNGCTIASSLTTNLYDGAAVMLCRAYYKAS